MTETPPDAPGPAATIHAAGTAYCYCPRGEDHESDDPEEDEAWDLRGPMGLAELNSKRQGERIAQLETQLAAQSAVIAAARAVAREWTKPEVDMAEVGFLLDDLVRELDTLSAQP